MTIREFLKQCFLPFILMALLIYSSSSRAAEYADEGAALAACWARVEAYVAPAGRVVCPAFEACNKSGNSYIARSGYVLPSQLSICDGAGSPVSLGSDTFLGSCSTRPVYSGYHQATLDYFNSGGLEACDNGCEVVGEWPVGDCQAADNNGNGTYESTEDMWCGVNWSANGSTCVPGTGNDIPPNSSPSENSFDCTNTQCVVPGEEPGPDSGSNPSTQDGIQSPPPVVPDTGGTQTGGSQGAGDGDSTTPIAGGGGGGAGQEDGDCNPLSNPDCDYTGQAGASGSCEDLPECAGDPVQCGILRQTWATACMDNGEVTIPSDCDAPVDCSGNIVNCASLQLARSQFCALFGDTDYITGNTPTSDADFDRDLKDEATTIDLANEIDTAGFQSGSCPADYSVAVFGSSVGVSFAPLCDLASIIRPLVIISSLLFGYMIIGGRR